MYAPAAQNKYRPRIVLILCLSNGEMAERSKGQLEVLSFSMYRYAFADPKGRRFPTFINVAFACMDQLFLSQKWLSGGVSVSFAAAEWMLRSLDKIANNA
jgi:hypothetical protein